MRVVIGLAGRTGVGKSSIAAYLKSNYRTETVSFATPLKHVVKDVFEFADDQVFGHRKNEIDPRWGISPRDAMQREGEAMRLHFGDDVHIQRAFRTINERPEVVWVIDDVRHVNEARAVARIGYVWRIHCEDYRVESSHRSETEVDEIPVTAVFKELRSSRAKGLSHLKTLADEAWEATRKTRG